MNIVIAICLTILLAMAFVIAAAGGIAAAWRGLNRRRGTFAALVAFATAMTICAQKPSGPAITIDALLRDAGCYATNDVFHVAVTNAPAYATVDFSACLVLVYAREHGSSANWVELLPRRLFGALPADYAIQGATNYDYMVYLDYIPPSPVHTNGVFELHGFLLDIERDGERSAGFINTAIQEAYTL